MIVPYSYKGWEPMPYLQETATKNLLDAYWWKYGYHQMGNGRSLDAFTMAVAPDVIRDFGQPDVMLVKLCDLDSARHRYGVYSDEAKEELQRHDEQLGVILETVKRYGDYDNTNIVILGDHGQTDVEDVLNINILLQRNGLSDIALAHTLGLSAWIELKNPEDEAAYKKVSDFLVSLKDHPDYQMQMWTKEEALAEFGLSGEFDFVIESKRDISMWEGLNEEHIFRSHEPGHKIMGRATHGGLPWRRETTMFIAAGPAVKPGVVIDKALMVDEAPTMAAMLGIQMQNTDGKILQEILM